jgi:integrase
MTPPAGRPRKHDPAIPAHIDQDRIPKGFYFRRRADGSGVWFVYERQPNGAPKRKPLANQDAKLSDLHAIAESHANSASGTLAWLLEQFHDSAKYRSLSKATREDYDYCRTVWEDFPTSAGLPLGRTPLSHITRVLVQVVVDTIAKGQDETRPGAGDAVPGYPSKANHALRYLRRVYEWAANRLDGFKDNPAKGVEQSKERKRRRLPTPDAYAAVLKFAREGAARKAHTKGSCAPYLPLAMELGYLCRLRPVETITLTDAHVLADGLQTNRRKGSRDNVVLWNPRLRAAVKAAQAYRDEVWKRAKLPTPMRPEDRTLIVSEDGGPLADSSWQTAWNRLQRAAVKAGVIDEAMRFGAHDLKRKGATDTKGNRADVQDAGGWRNAAMVDVYDLSLPRVDPAAGS